MEREIMTTKERVKELGIKMGEINQRMKGLETSMETIKGHLKDLRSSTVGRETDDKGKTPMGKKPLLSYSLPRKRNDDTHSWYREKVKRGRSNLR